MPNTVSARKRVRQNEKRRSRNRWRKRSIKEQVKSFLDAVHAGDVKRSEEEYRKVASLLDRVACTGTMHRNAAARQKSRLARRLNELQKTG